MIGISLLRLAEPGPLYRSSIGGVERSTAFLLVALVVVFMHVYIYSTHLYLGTTGSSYFNTASKVDLDVPQHVILVVTTQPSSGCQALSCAMCVEVLLLVWAACGNVCVCVCTWMEVFPIHAVH